MRAFAHPALLSSPFGRSPSVILERDQARSDEGKIVCLCNQEAEIEQVKQAFARVLCRNDVCSPASIDNDRLKPAVAAICLGIDVVRAKDQMQVCFRHINPPEIRSVDP
ncbi:hypothetical protein V1274_001354 [Bradyrhizobium sp. AZCC 1614]|uniref:hypothetical protein n=1 Tax=Bradyrhizobium sp. AZCC 1614 TaxID=3117017 RepID=UPI002FF0A225